MAVEFESSLIHTAELLGDRRRLSILTALLDGKAWPAGDLARHAGIKPATASYHLEQLVQGRLLAVLAQGRHRYYRLASHEVADLLEKLAAVVPPAPTRSLRGSTQRNLLSHARTCYDHLAGRLGVAWTEAWVNSERMLQVEAGYRITELGSQWLTKARLGAPSGMLVPAHAIDWTERVPHMAGPLAKALTEALFEQGWIERGAVARSVIVTASGRIAFAEFGVPREVLSVS